MNEQDKEKMLELLSEKAIFGLSEEELAELARLEKDFPALDDDSFELAAASIAMLNLETNEPMPAHLQSKIAADAEKYFAAQKSPAAVSEPPAETEGVQKTFAFEPGKSIWNWLGWAVAAAACVLLAVNIYTTRDELARSSQRISDLERQIPTPTPLTNPAQEMQRLLASNTDVVRSTWGDFDAKKQAFGIQGDVVWSNSAQKGFIRFTNLPVNDKTREQYQLWIFDANQKYPVDGGVFDANEAGELVVPIDAKIQIQKPTMFAVTAERPGGVVVSPLEKVMAVAKVPV
ncbi:MAG TPA: anti-sigma factor [Pyrinomonadaceae bacterium]|jgi:anti-sigma-K factor RskA